MNDELDVCSENFNPVEALYSDSLPIPVQNASVLDNVAKFESILSKCGSDVLISDVGKKDALKKVKSSSITCTSSAAGTSTAASIPEDSNEIQRNEVKGKNLQRLIEQLEGPLAFLKKCMDERIKVKIFTRNELEIRGYCVAFVTAFDTHWNLALEDVKEVWTRKIKRKTLPLSGVESKGSSEAFESNMTPPELKILNKTKKKETCVRYIPKILLRGEHVVLISIADH